jgi:small subunit ribosomal protein S20
LAHSSRTWRGARTPQGKKRVRQSQARHAILQPRRAAAKTEVKDALQAAAGGDAEATAIAVAMAASALDRAAKVGAIHANAAARRKSRLMRTVGSALGGQVHIATGKVQRQVSKAAAAKAAKARIAASKASKAKGEQTAAGKARAALSRSARAAKEAQSDSETVATVDTPVAASTRSTGTKATGTRTRSTTKPTGTAAKTSKAPSKTKTGS